MATLIRRADALRRINQLEEKAKDAGDMAGANWIVKCWNAVMSCKVEQRVFCNGCGKPVPTAKIPENEGGADGRYRGR